MKKHWFAPPSGVVSLAVAVHLASAVSAQECAVTREWVEAYKYIDISTMVLENKRPSEPVLLRASGEHYVMLNETCGGCAEQYTRQLELDTNLQYRWTLISGPGHLTTVANNQDYFKTTILSQSVLYQPPYDIHTSDPIQTAIIRCESFNADADKPTDVPMQATIEIAIDAKLDFSNFDIGLEDVDQTLQQRQYEYDITVTEDPDYGLPPINEGVAQKCFPEFEWKEDAPISGMIFAGPKDQQLSTLTGGEIVVLGTDASDSDEVDLWCRDVVFSDACEPDEEKQTFTHSDTLHYQWTASYGSFPLGDTGRNPIYIAPKTPAQVAFSCEASDISYQYSDGSEDLPRALNVIPDTVVLTSVGIAWIDPNDPALIAAQPAMTPPNAPEGVKKIAPLLLGGWGVNKTYFLRDNGNWKIQKGGGTPTPKHPWKNAVEVVTESVNNEPDSSFADWDAIENFLQTKQFRGLTATQFTALCRYGVVSELLLDDPFYPPKAIFHQGYTPLKQMTDAVPALGDAMGVWPGDYMLADGRNWSINVEDFLRVDEIEMFCVNEARLGTLANQINIWLTNRDAPWIHFEVKSTLRASGVLALDKFKVEATPAFPAYKGYTGEETSIMEVLEHPIGKGILDFTDNNGSPVDKKGV